MADYKQPHLNGAFYGPAIPPARTHRSIGRGGCDCCCLPCCLLSTLLKLLFSIIIIVGIIVLVLWLVLRPNEIKSYVETATLSNFDLSNNTNNILNYNLSMDLSIRNPNKRISIYYDYIESQALYDDSRIGFKILDPFYQGHKNTTLLHPEFGSRTAVLSDSVASTYKREKGEGFFYVDVKIYMKLRLKIWIFKFRGFKPKIDCTLKLPVPIDGRSVSTFERTKCDVDY